jgi:hypothetical protein
MICSRCEKVGKDMEKIFTKIERMSLLAAQIALLRSIESGRNDSNDKVVANSVISKTLLSFEHNSRGILIEHFEKSIGMRITLGSCPHGLQIVS